MTNKTLALDTATMAHALTALSRKLGSSWEPVRDNETQERFFTWYDKHADEVAKLQNLKGMISSSASVLNRFLEEHGFRPLFREIAGGGLGAASILDMLVEWAVKAARTDFYLYTDHEERSVDAFSIPAQGAEFFTLPSGVGEGLLVRLHTKNNSSVWLLMGDCPESGLHLVRTAMLAMASREQVRDTRMIGSVIIPTLDIDTQPSLDWMVGAYCGGQTIDQAFQQFKLRMNDEGARVKVATGFATRGGGPVKKPVLFDRPFMGWFTQPGSELPIATFYAHYDSWKTPAGSLAQL